jgi:hypothetical protein
VSASFDDEHPASIATAIETMTANRRSGMLVHRHPARRTEALGAATSFVVSVSTNIDGDDDR